MTEENIMLTRAKAGEWDKVDDSYLEFLTKYKKFPDLVEGAQDERRRRRGGGGTGLTPAVLGTDRKNMSPNEYREDIKASLVSLVPQLSAIVPQIISAQTIVQAIINSVVSNNKILGCTKLSILKAAMACAYTGLMPDTPQQHCHIIPYKETATWQIGYRGLIALGETYSGVIGVDCECVYTKEKFAIKRIEGTRVIEHEQILDDEKGDFRGAYAIIYRKDKMPVVEWMNAKQINDIKMKSQAGRKGEGPWGNDKDFPQMARKTVLKRAFNYVGIDVRTMTAVQLDHQAVMGEDQQLPYEVDAEIIKDVVGEPDPETKSDKMARKFEKKNGKPEERPKPEPDNARTPSRMELEAELFSLIAENEDMLKSILGEDSEVLKYNNKQVAGWTVGGVQDAIKEVRMILDSAAEPDDDVEPELGLGAR